MRLVKACRDREEGVSMEMRVRVLLLRLPRVCLCVF